MASSRSKVRVAVRALVKRRERTRRRIRRRIDSQGVDPRSLNWKISSPGKSAGPKPRTLVVTASAVLRARQVVAGCAF
jgi:hypothetical protein